MILSSFPDINVWLALSTPEHVHHPSSKRWWDEESRQIAFSRTTQMGFLRLMTTAAVMDGQPLTMAEAWHTYDRLFEDDRVGLYPEPVGLEAQFRQLSNSRIASPKVWADAYLVAFSFGHEAQLVTFDRALENRGAHCLVLQ